ncbi:MAG: Response regulator of the LytR/AlgR family [Lachnospiraceae bacterium]|jgi:DNA-binding LytR/AlgR family response regulator|nr:Response regulator of the LytR/AlgR family [Anaerocolumna sp.]MDF2609210.1 Response regulator of the LytR/AlgR family [Lachnospiraceae bacterium]
MTVKIAICDDERIFIEELSRQLEILFVNESIDIQIKSYQSGRKLLSDSNDLDFDILFLDIDMPEITGIDIAEQIRRKNQFVHIIFITSHEDLVYQSIQYRPFRFIRKCYAREELPEAVTALKRKICNENNLFSIKFNGTESSIRYADISYIESYRHDIFVHTTKETYRIKGNLGNLEKQCENYGFIRVHSGYLVNYRYIFSIDKSKVRLINEEEIPLSRHRTATVKQKLQYYVRQGV